MSSTPDAAAPTDESTHTQGFFIGIGVGIAILTIALIVLAVILTLNVESAAPAVEIIRDLLIITLALELLVIGTAITVFTIQAARLVNLLNNEIQPIITSTQDTVNTVRGTAVFLSKNLTEPIIAASSTLRAIQRTMKDVDAIKKATSIAVAAAAAAASSGTRGVPRGDPAVETDKSDNIDATTTSVHTPENQDTDTEARFEDVD